MAGRGVGEVGSGLTSQSSVSHKEGFGVYPGYGGRQQKGMIGGVIQSSVF